ncbi:MAG: sensor histidine kinase [Pseudomonadota bacterium]
MKGALSLRARLTAIILTPLILIALAVGVWAVSDARTRAEDRFDRALLTAALAVSRDVALSGGDALSPATSSLLSSSTSGPLFYHVFAPDGVFVTGYATPPVPTDAPAVSVSGQQVFEGVHQSRTVRAVRFTDMMQLDGINGEFTVTVWQNQSDLSVAVRELVQGTLAVISLLVATVGFVVWFGVRYGLQPLNDLEDAIARRNSDDLGVIRRNVPVEVTGIVERLNSLFGQLGQSMAAQAEFISNAAHQLRNPIAGVLSLAEAVDAAPTPDEAKRRSKDLLDAVRDTSELSQKLLLLERAKALSPGAIHAEFALSDKLERWVSEMEGDLPDSVEMLCEIEPGLQIKGDETMLREALRNLFQNALQHGGPGLSKIAIKCWRAQTGLRLTVTDNGSGMSDADVPRAFKRFELVAPTSGSGLGVSIVDAVARAHGGKLSLAPMSPGLRADVTLPIT